jgi:hypothetical protein
MLFELMKLCFIIGEQAATGLWVPVVQDQNGFVAIDNSTNAFATSTAAARAQFEAYLASVIALVSTAKERAASHDKESVDQPPTTVRVTCHPCL